LAADIKIGDVTSKKARKLKKRRKSEAGPAQYAH